MKQPLLSHDGNVYGFIPSNYNRIDLFYNQVSTHMQTVSNLLIWRRIIQCYFME